MLHATDMECPSGMKVQQCNEYLYALVAPLHVMRHCIVSCHTLKYRVTHCSVSTVLCNVHNQAPQFCNVKLINEGVCASHATSKSMTGYVSAHVCFEVAYEQIMPLHC